MSSKHSSTQLPTNSDLFRRDVALIKPNLDLSTITAASRVVIRSVLVLGCCCYNVCGAGPWVFPMS